MATGPESSAVAGLAVKRGRLLAYRLFDIGLEVRLEDVERLVTAEATRPNGQLRISANITGASTIRNILPHLGLNDEPPLLQLPFELTDSFGDDRPIN